MAITNYFDFWDIIVNQLLGSVEIFIVFGLIIVIYFAIRKNMSGAATILMSVLFLSIIVAKTSSNMIWVYIILAAGIILYIPYNKLIKR